MDYVEISEKDYCLFHELANAYYREGEDEHTPAEEIDAFIRLLFQKVIAREISGCFAKAQNTCIGFALWTVDTEDFAFCEMPGYGTILEIGLLPAFRAAGHGREFVSFIELCLRRRNVTQCYVSAYGPAQKFWTGCGYAPNGNLANNGLPILVKRII